MSEETNKYVRERLLKEHSANEFGTWRILGEDPNCDYGGSHHEPELETVIGTYINVVDYAMSLGSFFTWGGGGRILKQPTGHKNIDKVMTNPRIKQLEKERKEIHARLATVEQELAELNKVK